MTRSSFHRSSSPELKKMDARICFDTQARREANMLSGYQKPLVMTLVTPASKSAVTFLRKSRLKINNAPEQPVVSISEKQKEKVSICLDLDSMNLPALS
jgi:hypothetical protein